MENRVPEPRNPDLMAKTRTYVQAALRWLACQEPSRLPLMEQPHRRWSRIGDNVYQWQAETRHVSFAFLVNGRELHNLQEYSSAVAALEADLVISPQLDQLVGSAGSAMRLAKDTILDGIGTSSLQGGDLRFDEDGFLRAYLAREAELYSSNASFVVLAPIIGLADAPLVRFEQIELDRMTSDEAQFLLDSGQLSSSFTAGDVVQTTTEYVLRLRYVLPKRIGDLTSDSAPPSPNVSEGFIDILSAMRLLKEGVLALPMIITRGQYNITWSHLASGRTVNFPTYSLSHSEVNDLLTLWWQLASRSVKERDFLGTAIRRFSYAGERDRVEDRFVDLMIAAEAMFLGEKRKGETTGELTQKISMRFAHFVTVPGTTRRQRYEHMKKAYSIRSTVVHGDRPKGFKKPGELEQFTDATANYLRQALRIAIAWAHVNSNRRPLIDWDELILGR
jgi:hypothetical protein